MINFAQLEKKLNLKFKRKDLVKSAFIHRSYLNEHPEENLPHNERLEFLGDAVLGFIVSDYLFRTYSSKSEGDLTNYRSSIVNAKILSEVAADLSLGSYLLLSRGEEATGGRTRQYILANTYESFLGAIFLDLGLEASTNFIQKTLIPKLKNIIEKKLYKDYKSNLQELSQERFSITPSYKVLKEEGPDHAKTFIIGVYLGKKKIAEGNGGSKQAAEQSAAKAALENLNLLD